MNYLLLDIDDTLLKKNSGKYNMALINAIKGYVAKNPKTRIILVTAYKLEETYGPRTHNTQRTRLQVLQSLKRQGIEVHAVVTSASAIFEKDYLGQYYDSTVLPLEEKNVALYKRDQENNTQHLYNYTEKAKKQFLDEKNAINKHSSNAPVGIKLMMKKFGEEKRIKIIFSEHGGTVQAYKKPIEEDETLVIIHKNDNK